MARVPDHFLLTQIGYKFYSLKSWTGKHAIASFNHVTTDGNPLIVELRLQFRDIHGDYHILEKVPFYVMQWEASERRTKTVRR